MYLSSELFINEFIDAIQHSNLVKFRKRYRQADLLLIDDIQFLGGKERSQEEFFHTFNTLFDGHKQIVLSSDRPASEITNLEKRLVSRFEWGLTAELQPPDIETRMAILRKKARTMQIKLRDDVFEFLANRIRTNVRRLEGALMRVASFASLSGKELTQEVVEHLLKVILQEEARHSITIEQIQRRVAEHYDVRLADMTSKRRPANIAFPRQVAMYLARELTKASLSEIGEAFGGRDHGTVLHAHKLVKERIKSQEKVRQTVHFLDRELPAPEISIEVDSKNIASIRSGPSFFKILGLPEEEFPPLPKFEDAKSFTIPQKDLKEGLKKTSYAISTDETRYVLNGILCS